jgi:hypothetical protein
MMVDSLRMVIDHHELMLQYQKMFPKMQVELMDDLIHHLIHEYQLMEWVKG